MQSRRRDDAAQAGQGETRPRIAVGGIFIECNDFGGQPADLAAFERTTLARGRQLLDIKTGVAGGMLSALDEHGAEAVPLVFAAATPSGPITSSCYRQLKNELLSALESALPVDGVLLPLHGSAAAEDVDDPEGDLIAAVRRVVGDQTPVVMTLDLHASVTEAMVRSSDAILGWETYPHSDSYTTGERGARMLLQILRGDIKPVMVMGKVPMVTGAVHTATADPGPFGDIMKWAKSAEGKGSVVSASVFLVHPYLDRPEMGSGALVITDDDEATAVNLASALATEYWRRRFEFEPDLHTPEAAVKRGLAIDGGPVILVEVADCVGGGAAGDSVATLRALIEAGVSDESLLPVVDPGAAAACHEAGTGAQVTLSLGHALDPAWGQPLEVTGTVDRLSDGSFSYEGGIFEGAATMGPSAVLAVGAIKVLVTTHATYEWLDEQYRAVGLNPEGAKFVVAKSTINHLMAYGDFARDIIVLDTPGPTPGSVAGWTFKRMKRPFFPFDRDLPGLEPTLLR